jgi:hypothetical protein
MTLSQTMQDYKQILEHDVHELARATGAVKRVRKGGLDAATLVQSIIFGLWQDPDMPLSGLSQTCGRRQVHVSEAAISQRFTPECAELFRQLMERLSAVPINSEPVDIALLRPFAAVIVEDSTSIVLPAALASVWSGCGGNDERGEACVKAFVQWDVLRGTLKGPRLTDGRTNDHRSPFAIEELPAGCLYLADLGFFGVQRLKTIMGDGTSKRYVVSRLQAGTKLYTRGGHALLLAGLLPQQVGQVRELGVILGRRDGVAMRLILVRVPPEVAHERQERIRRAAHKHGHEPSAAALALTHWTILLTNVPRRLARYEQVLVLMRLRWQIERLFRLWKEQGKVDEWRSKKPYRILAELYAKLCAMLLQQCLLHHGCWLDPYRSIVKAAASLRRECNRLMVAFFEDQDLDHVVGSILSTLRAGCHIERRASRPSTPQLLLEGLDWKLELLLT